MLLWKMKSQQVILLLSPFTKGATVTYHVVHSPTVAFTRERGEMDVTVKNALVEMKSEQVILLLSPSTAGATLNRPRCPFSDCDNH